MTFGEKDLSSKIKADQRATTGRLRVLRVLMGGLDSVLPGHAC